MRRQSIGGSCANQCQDSQKISCSICSPEMKFHFQSVYRVGYDLDIRYRRGRDAIVFDALGRRPDFNHLNVLSETDHFNNDFVPRLIQFLINHTLPDDTTIRERIIQEVQNYELDDEQ